MDAWKQCGWQEMVWMADGVDGMRWCGLQESVDGRRVDSRRWQMVWMAGECGWQEMVWVA